MKSFNNQQVIKKVLIQENQSRGNVPCEILETPGFCDGLVNTFHRQAIKEMKKNQSLFTLDIARNTAKKKWLGCVPKV